MIYDIYRFIEYIPVKNFHFDCHIHINTGTNYFVCNISHSIFAFIRLQEININFYVFFLFFLYFLHHFSIINNTYL